ncbi:hypothetical protein D3C80_1871030 [compost metagenome]
MALGGSLDGADKCLLVTDIRHRPLSLAAGIADARGYCLQRFFITTAEHHRGALFGETFGRGRTNARTGTGDKSDFSLQTCAHSVLPA